MSEELTQGAVGRSPEWHGERLMVLGAGGDRNWASTLVKATAKDHDFTGLGDFTQPYCRYTACQGKARAWAGAQCLCQLFAWV